MQKTAKEKEEKLFKDKYQFMTFVGLSAQKTLTKEDGRFYLVPIVALKEPLLSAATKTTNIFAYFWGPDYDVNLEDRPILLHGERYDDGSDTEEKTEEFVRIHSKEKDET